MMAPMPSKSPAKRPAFMLSVTETDSASSVPSSPPTSSGKFLCNVYFYCDENVCRISLMNYVHTILSLQWWN